MTSDRLWSGPWPMPNCKGNGCPQTRGQESQGSPGMNDLPSHTKVAHGLVRDRVILARCAFKRCFERGREKNDDPREKECQSWQVCEERPHTDCDSRLSHQAYSISRIWRP